MASAFQSAHNVQFPHPQLSQLYQQKAASLGHHFGTQQQERPWKRDVAAVRVSRMLQQCCLINSQLRRGTSVEYRTGSQKQHQDFKQFLGGYLPCSCLAVYKRIVMQHFSESWLQANKNSIAWRNINYMGWGKIHIKKNKNQGSCFLQVPVQKYRFSNNYCWFEGEKKMGKAPKTKWINTLLGKTNN